MIFCLLKQPHKFHTRGNRKVFRKKSSNFKVESGAARMKKTCFREKIALKNNISDFTVLQRNQKKFIKSKKDSYLCIANAQNPITKSEKSKYKDPQYARSETTAKRELKTLAALGAPVETDRFILLISNLGGLIVINKQTSEVVREGLIEEKQLGVLWVSNFIPIDGDENRFMFTVDAEKWLKEVAAHPDKIAPKWKKKNR